MLQRCVHILALSQFYLNPNCSIPLTAIMRGSLFNVCSFNVCTLENLCSLICHSWTIMKVTLCTVAFFVSSIIFQYYFLWSLDKNLFKNYICMWKNIYRISIYLNIWCFLVSSVTLILCIFLCQYHIFWYFSSSK